MKQQQTYIKQVAFRFRRWSRKRYAAFFSINRAVTIGQLSSNVSERFQTKNCTTHASVLFAGQTVNGAKDEFDDLSEERSDGEGLSWQSLHSLILAPLLTVKQTSAAVVSAYINIHT